MGFSGRASKSRHYDQVMKALRRKHTVNKATHTEVRFDGEARPFITFHGPLWHATGRMDFMHCGSRVLSVDFDRDMITDFGYSGYSMTTSTNISRWLNGLRNARLQGMYSLDVETCPFRWTFSTRHNPRSVPCWGGAHENDMFERFRDGVAWVEVIDNEHWFLGSKFNPARVEDYDNVKHDVLDDGVSWHWYTGGWTDSGRWSKRFIDDAAKARWEKRQARLTRTLRRQEAPAP